MITFLGDDSYTARVIGEREAVCAVLLDDRGCVGMIEATLGGYYKLPGGGVYD